MDGYGIERGFGNNKSVMEDLLEFQCLGVWNGIWILLAVEEMVTFW
jgi:hypothetical protein